MFFMLAALASQSAVNVEEEEEEEDVLFSRTIPPQTTSFGAQFYSWVYSI